eukprot:TRINITY_DN2198_c0_g2_i1.p1 TRINITY_DN2198_c0_g2~~TRINITY_DN2198_c0_g2_i1.p1  ORF type:complete len:337 (+),score=21.41 TRINITY_DN2198_c0_g2_i1:16-1026(+)
MSCQNITCFGHGECVLTDGLPVCMCGSRFDAASQCEINFFEIWGGSILIYIWFGLIITLILLFLVGYELVRDFIKYSRGRIKLVILPKIASFIFLCFRLGHYGLFYEYYHYDNDGSRFIADEVVYVIGLTAGLSIYTCIILLWIDFATGVKNLDLSDDLTKQFKWSAVVLVLVLVSYVPASITLHAFGTLGKETTVALTAYSSITMIYLLIMIIWSSVLVHSMNKVLRSFPGKFLKFRFRNNLLATLTAVITFLGVVQGILEVFKTRENPWGYLGNNVFIRVAEWTIVILALMISQNHLKFTTKCFYSHSESSASNVSQKSNIESTTATLNESSVA